MCFWGLNPNTGLDLYCYENNIHENKIKKCLCSQNWGFTQVK